MTNDVNRSTLRDGVAAAVIAYTAWGFMPAYFKWMDAVTALEMLAHRVVWSVPFGAFIIALRRQWGDVRSVFSHGKILLMLIASAAFIASNWFVYVWAVQNEQIFQASLGYYINPLLYVLVGVIVFKEKLSGLQLLAVVLATVSVLMLTILGGQFPMIAVYLAVSFTAYGVIRKQAHVAAMPGLFVETLLLVLPAVAYLVWLNQNGALYFGSHHPGASLALTLAGPFTVIPLLFFAIAARRLPLSLLGFLQFIGPTLQFLLGVYFGEPLTTPYVICFVLIWIAVAIFSYDSWQKSRTSLTPAI